MESIKRSIYFIVGIVMLALGSAANACPDVAEWGERYTFTANDLYETHYFEIVAGGDVLLSDCGIRAKNYRGALPGWVISPPDFTFEIKQMGGYQIDFRVIGDCDSVLLVNTAAENWYFDDDDLDAEYGDPVISLTNPAGDGLYDVWVGSYDSEECNAELQVETF